MFLAEHYYEVGDIDKCYYWYKIAATTSGDHQGAALNNLACIGLTYGYYDEKSSDDQLKALDMFRKAIFLGNAVAVQNMYTFLKECQVADLPGIQYNTELVWVIRVAAYYNIDLHGLAEEEWKAALADFHLDRNAGIIDNAGNTVYPNVGYFPAEDVFISDSGKKYNSYEYTGPARKA